MPADFDLSRTAVLCMDCQGGLVHIYAKPKEEFLDRASRVLKAARIAALPVIYIQVGFRPGLPEANDRNKFLRALKASPEHQKLFEGQAGAIHPALAPEPSDIVITKHRVSAFTGTDLEIILRSNQVETLILFGIATSGVVLSTMLEAGDADYNVVVISDCCADLDVDLHDALINRLFTKRAEVLSAADFITALASK